MSTGVSTETHSIERKEDFPYETYQYMESKLQVLREIVMELAAQLARDTESHPYVYQVKNSHIDAALTRLVVPDIAETKLGAHDSFVR